MKFIIDIPDGYIGGGIYRIRNDIDSRIYVGRTKDFIKRGKQHRRSFKGGLCNKKLRIFIEEHPEVVFIFEVMEETEDLKSREEELIAENDAVDNGFNILRNDEEFLIKYRGLLGKKEKKREKKIVIKEPKVKVEKEKKEETIDFKWLQKCKTAKLWLKKRRN